MNVKKVNFFKKMSHFLHNTHKHSRTAISTKKKSNLTNKISFLCKLFFLNYRKFQNFLSTLDKCSNLNVFDFENRVYFSCITFY